MAILNQCKINNTVCSLDLPGTDITSKRDGKYELEGSSAVEKENGESVTRSRQRIC
jgi:hypothetical protein